MGGEDERGPGAAVGRDLGERRGGAIRDGLDEERVVGPAGGEHDLGRSGDLRPRRRDVLLVALPRGLGAERGEDDPEGAPRPARRHRRQRLGEVGMPMAHAGVDRQRPPGVRERGPERRRLPLGQLSERGSPARHLLVVARDLLDALARDPAAARDVVEEGANLLAGGGPPERDQQDGVDHAPRRLIASTCREPCPPGR